MSDDHTTDAKFVAVPSAAHSPALALRGLREAASDVVEMLQDLQGPQLAAFDARVAKKLADEAARERACKGPGAKPPDQK